MKYWKYRSARYLYLLILISAAAGSGYAENVNGRVAGTVSGDGTAISFKPEELVVIEAGRITGFQEGMELRLRIPEGLRKYQNSFALLVFRSISPVPSLEKRSYSGSRAFMRLLPTRDSMFVRIPYSSAHGLTGDALTDVLPLHIGTPEFPLIVTVLPVMKGIPDSAFTEALSISAVTLLKNEGTLKVNITNPSGHPDEIIDIAIDGTPIPGGETISLEAGIHRVRIDSSRAPAVEKNIAIEPGEEVVLGIVLDYRPPEVLVSIPEGATLLLDGSPVGGSESPILLEIEPGDHSVTYRLGEMDVTRNFSISPGGKVTIDLIIDINIVDFGDGTGNAYGAGDG